MAGMMLSFLDPGNTGRIARISGKDDVRQYLSNLGFVPPDSRFSCAEFHDFRNLHRIRREHPYFEKCHVICCSDAHYLEDIHEPEYQILSGSRKIKDILKALARCE